MICTLTYTWQRRATADVISKGFIQKYTLNVALYSLHLCTSPQKAMGNRLVFVLQEMKRNSGMLKGTEEEEELSSEDEDSSDDDDNVGSAIHNFRVFCCSSTEYQKIRKLQTDDGLAQVMETLKATVLTYILGTRFSKLRKVIQITWTEIVY